MRKKLRYHYFVEGEDEQRLVNVLKSDLRCIQSGKVQVFNVIQLNLKQESPDMVGRGMRFYFEYWLRIYFSTTSRLIFPSVPI